MARRRSRSLGVDWHLPAPGGGFRARPFVSTTVADSDMLRAIADYGYTFAGAAKAFDSGLMVGCSTEARAVLDGFIGAGHGDAPMAPWIR
jgi:hypothetical protein